MDEEGRQAFLGAPAADGGLESSSARVVAALFQGLDDAPGLGGSADRHTDVRGSEPQVGHAQEVAPD
jgi:hypothetical protein